jgi:CDK inhibitor PHO81
VLLCNDLGIDGSSPKSTVPSSGKTVTSVKEAVSVSMNNNFMGLICRSRLLVGLIKLQLKLNNFEID